MEAPAESRTHTDDETDNTNAYTASHAGRANPVSSIAMEGG